MIVRAATSPFVATLDYSRRSQRRGASLLAGAAAALVLVVAPCLVRAQDGAALGPPPASSGAGASSTPPSTSASSGADASGTPPSTSASNATPSTTAPPSAAPSTPLLEPIAPTAGGEQPPTPFLGDRPRNMRDEHQDQPMVLAPPQIFRGPDVEGFAARDVDSFNSHQFGWGGGAAAYVESLPFAFLGVHLGGALFAFTPGDAPSGAGTMDGAFYWGIRLGLRFHWSALLNWRGVDAWVDAHDAFGRSGEVSREGFDFGVGAAFSVHDALGLGPFARMMWASAPSGIDPWILLFGLNVEVMPPVARYVVDERHESSTAGGRPHVHPHEFANEDVDLAPRRPRVDHEPLVLDAEAFGSYSFFPAGAATGLGFGGGLAPHLELALAKEFGMHLGGAFSLVSSNAGSAVYVFASQVGARFHWSALFPQTVGDGWIDVHHEFIVSGGIGANGFDVGTGFTFNISRIFSLGPFVRFSYGSSPDGTNPITFTFGVSFGVLPQMRGGVEIEDADHDGVADDRDFCPHDAAGPHPDRDNPGCPDHDRDHDGLRDADDHCPSEPMGQYPDLHHPGCPLPDSDGDGIPNSLDFCPDVPSGGHRDSLHEGCPQ